MRVKLPFPTPGFQSCYNSDEEGEGDAVKVLTTTISMWTLMLHGIERMLDFNMLENVSGEGGKRP